jgi:YHS domain-containing protein
MEADYMKRLAKIVGLAILVAVAFLAGHWHNVQKQSTSSAFGGRRILYCHDPMHPAYKANTPGIAPDCGMQVDPAKPGGKLVQEGKTYYFCSSTCKEKYEARDL